MVTSLTQPDLKQMRDQVFFEGPERNRRLSRYWLLLLLSAVIATAGVVSDSTATVIGAMIIAPLMTPILGVVLGVVTADRANLGRCLLLLAAGAAVVVAVSWLLGHVVPYPVPCRHQWPGSCPGHPPAGGPGGRPGHRGGWLGRAGPARYLRHPARRGHRHLAGAAADRGRPDPSVRVAQPVPGGAVAVRHQRGCHPSQRHRGDGAVPGRTGSRPGGRSGVPPPGRRGHHRPPAGSGARPVVGQFGPGRQDHDPAKRRAGGGRAVGQRRGLVSGWRRRHG